MTCWLSTFSIECPCFCAVILSLSSPRRLKQPTCCSISVEMRRLLPNLSLQRHWEELRKQPTITWTQIEELSCEVECTETHMANGDTWTHTQRYFSDRGHHIINPTFPVFYLIFVSYVVQLEPTALSKE